MVDSVETSQQLADEEEAIPPTTQEILDAIGRLKAGKSAGEDGVPAELFQVDPLLFAEYLSPKYSHEDSGYHYS